MQKIFKQLSLICLSAILFTACSVKEPSIEQPKSSDIVELSKTANDNFINQNEASRDFFQKYFIPWNAKKVSYPKAEAMWGQS